MQIASSNEHFLGMYGGTPLEKLYPRRSLNELKIEKLDLFKKSHTLLCWGEEEDLTNPIRGIIMHNIVGINPL